MQDSKDLNRTLDRVAQNLEAESGVVVQESERVKALIAEAVSLMSDSFHTMHRLATDQMELTSGLVCGSAQNRAEPSLKAAVEALQEPAQAIVQALEGLSRASAEQDEQIAALSSRLAQLEDDLLSNRLSEDQIRREFADNRALLEQLSTAQSQPLNGSELGVKRRQDEFECALDQVFQAYQALTNEVQSIIEIGDQLSSSAASAVRSLQFEDMASQALGSLAYNASSLVRLAEHLRQVANSEGQISLEALAELEAICAQLIRDIENRNASRTVAQENLDEGDIELF